MCYGSVLFEKFRPCDIVLILAAAACTGVAVTAVIEPAKYLYSPVSAVVMLGGPVAGLAVLAWTLSSSREVRRNAGLMLGGMGLALYFCEMALIAFEPQLIAMTRSRGFDNRSKLEVVEELRAEGQAAYPSISPRQLTDREVRLGGAARTVPLGGVRNSATVLCNESGEYSVYQSDEFGFPNPRGVWKSGEIDVALLGDSFAQGFCVPPERNFAAGIRSVVPKTVNTGNSGNGPLAELAVVREYLEYYRPKRVLWFYYEGNDLEDLTREMLDPTLGRYLADPFFTQRLLEHASRNDELLRDYLEEEMERERQERLHFSWSDLTRRFREASKLYNLRARFGVVNFRRGWVLDEYRTEVSSEDLHHAFRQILHEVVDRVREWGGEVWFVYLPGWESFAHFDGFNEHPFRRSVLASVRSAGIPVIDLVGDFRQLPNPLSMFPEKANLHYNERGHDFVARAVLSAIAGSSDRGHGPFQSGQ